MLGVAMYTTIETLWILGHNKSEISRLTGHDWKTISKVIKDLEAGKKIPIKRAHPKKLDAYKEQILEWLEQGLSGVRIHQKLMQQGVGIGYSTVKYFISDIKKREEVFIRFHSLPGEEGQVDFGYFGLTVDDQGHKRKTWVFNMRLSYSRLDYYEKVYDQKVETFIQCHINAFEYFRGIPKYIKIDNLKAAILEANFYEPVYQVLYKQFAQYYGFQPIPCRVHKPNEKGKVESGIKYVKKNFYAGRRFSSGSDLDKQLREWQDNICNARIHGTTRRIPRDLFDQEEQEKLLSLPLKAFRLPQVGQRIVYHDCHVYIEYNYYSVPYKYIGKTVDIEVDTKLVRINYQGEQIALHTRIKDKGKFCTNPNHYPVYKRINSEEYKNKLSMIGQYAEELFKTLLERQPNHWYNTVKGILSLRKKYSDKVINLSCRRALIYDAICYRQIKSICHSGCYNLPIENREA
jgi:transposase